MSGTLTEFAPAKINLSLRIGALDTDGYHPVDSVVAFADTGDMLSFMPASKFSLHVHGPFAHGLPTDERNLVCKAVNLLAQTIGLDDPGVHVDLRKDVPIASGIGGGSADAAATLRGLNRLWKARLRQRQLAEIGARLGSDIPVCLYGSSSDDPSDAKNWFRMQGRGEQVTKMTRPSAFAALLVNPRVSVSTADVFAKFDELSSQTKSQGFAHGLPFADGLQLAAFQKQAKNDLTPAALILAPVIGEVLDALRQVCAQGWVQMCGSGATCFAGFETSKERDAAAMQMRQQYPHWWVKPVQIG